MNIAPRVMATMRTVVRIEARIIFIGLARRIEAAEGRIAQLRVNQNAKAAWESELQTSAMTLRGLPQATARSAEALRNSAQTRPIVRNEYRIARIRGIVFHAGRLARNKPLETDLPFKAGNVLRRVISDAGNRVTVSYEVPRPQIHDGLGTRTEKLSLHFARLVRMFRQLDDLTLRNSPDLIQVQAPPALHVLGLFRRTKKSIGDHHDRRNGRAGHCQNKFPVCEQSFQLKISIGANKLCSEGHSLSDTVNLAARKKKAFRRIRPTGVYFTERVAPSRNYVCGACTGLRNTPTPLTLTSTTSPATSGPTPAGVPVAIKSPGKRVITREIQRTRNATGYAISEVLPDWRSAPLTSVSTKTSVGLSCVSICGPTGQKVSKPLARVNCTSLFCRSRAVTSLRQL